MLRFAVASCTAAAVALGGGFAWFVRDASAIRPIPEDADGIVVLTGGSLRVETGLALLEARVAPRLLISGVGDGVSIASVVAAAGLPAASWRGGADGRPDLDDRDGAPLGRSVLALEPRWRNVTLGRGARTTVGNAVETATWAREDGLHSLVVVTAGYHMRRALSEIGTLLPDVSLRPFPVHPHAPLRLLGVEYLKWLAVELGASPMPSGAADT